MTSSNIKSWWHSFQLSVEWWKFSDHNVFSWQLPPFWVAMLSFYLLVGFHIWQLVIHGSWDSVTLGNKECCPWQHNFYSQFPVTKFFPCLTQLGILVLNISFYTASCFILELTAVFRFFYRLFLERGLDPPFTM